MCCCLYCVFTYIYSLMIEKDICDCWNASFKLPCVCVCLSSGVLFIFSVRVSCFFFYFLCHPQYCFSAGKSCCAGWKFLFFFSFEAYQHSVAFSGPFLGGCHVFPIYPFILLKLLMPLKAILLGCSLMSSLFTSEHAKQYSRRTWLNSYERKGIGTTAWIIIYSTLV